jgi:hypothetical protein
VLCLLEWQKGEEKKGKKIRKSISERNRILQLNKIKLNQIKPNRTDSVVAIVIVAVIIGIRRQIGVGNTKLYRVTYSISRTVQYST